MQKMLDLDEIGTEKLRGAIASLIGEKDIDLLCHALPKYLLNQHQERNVIEGEFAFHHCTHAPPLLPVDSALLCCRAPR